MNSFLLAAWLTACGGDAATTHVALRRGAREVVLTQNPWANDAIIVGNAAWATLLVSKLHQEHPKVATGLLIGMTVIRVAVVRNNIGVIRAQH